MAKITQKIGLKRSTVHLILDRMVTRGFISFHIEEAHKEFSVEDPSRILLNLEDTVTDFKNIIPLLTVSKFGGIKSQVRFRALFNLLWDSLNNSSQSSPMLQDIGPS